MQKLVGNVRLEYEEVRAADFQGQSVSYQKAKKELGWEPKVDFEEGARRYIEWYKVNVLKGKK